MLLLVLLWAGVAMSCTPSPLRSPGPLDDEPLPLPQPSVALDSQTPFTQTQPTQNGLRLEDVKHQLNSRQIAKIQRAAQKLRKQKARAAHQNKGANKTNCIIRSSSVATKEGTCIYMGGFCRIPGGQGIYYNQVSSMWW